MDKKEFLTLLDKYLAGKASPDEEGLLFSIYQSFQTKQEWNRQEQEALDKLEDRLYEKIKFAINTPKAAPKVKHLPVLRYAVAASILLCLALGLIYTFRPRVNMQVAENVQPPLKNDFKAGGNKAYLILANGKIVHLNQAKIGLLAQQGGNSVIKQNNGQIVYSPNSTSVFPTDSIPLNKIVVPIGGQYRVALPDGTNVWLNSASSLEYPVQFVGNERHIKLTGEAYFEVAKNKKMPFIVDVNSKMNVKVLGTHFNIMAYTDENKISTTLLEGSVKIEDRSNLTNNAYLIPGQQADMLANSNIKVGAADVDETIAWKEGQFIFNNENIHSIMRKLSRWYDVDVVFAVNMKDKCFDGSISRYKNISEVLKLMELTKGVHFKFQGRRILVMP